MPPHEEMKLDAEEAAIAFGNIAGSVALPTVMMGRSLSTNIVRSDIAKRTILDLEVLNVASKIISSEGEDL